MQDLLTSGRIVDLILIVMAVEALVLLTLWQRLGQGVRPMPLLANLAAGGTLLLALRVALTGGSAALLALLLLLSLFAHVIDLLCRWSAAPPTGASQKP